MGPVAPMAACCDPRADRGEASIAPKALAKRCMANKAEAEGGDGRPQHATAAAWTTRAPITTMNMGQPPMATALALMAATGHHGNELLRARAASTRAPPGICPASDLQPAHGEDEADIPWLQDCVVR